VKGLCFVGMALVACGGPVASQPQPIEAEPRALLEAVRRHDASAITALLADDVTAIASDGGVTGVATATQALSTLTLASDALIEAHHGVARVTEADGTLLFVQSDGAGHISQVVRFAPADHVEASATITAYQQSWNVAGAARIPLLEQGWSTTGTYLDPTAKGVGRDGLGQVIDAFRARVPGVRLDGHADALGVPGWVTFSWTAVAGSDTIEGFDVAQLDGAGQVALIAGFFSKR
jgi:hypothetical protein